MKRYFSFAFLLGSVLAFGQEDRIKEVENGLTPLVRFTDEPSWNILDRMAHYNTPGVTVAVIKDYKIDWAKAYGLADASSGEKATTETAFQAASISKTINAIGILKWANENDIDLDADINTLLKSWEFPYDTDAEKISMRNLLTHTAGLSVHGFRGYKSDKKLPTTVQILNGEKPANSPRIKSLFAPNEKFKYSGGGTTISQLILEDHVGDFAAYMNENLFQPLGMDRSFYPSNFKGNVSMSHQRNGEKRKNGFNVYPEYGAAALWITPTDLAKLLIELQLSLEGKSEKILSKEVLRTMLTPWKEGESNALGTFIDTSGGIKYFQHSGGNEGFNCLYYASMEDGHGAVVMINNEQFDLIYEIMRSIASTYGWKVFQPKVTERFDMPSMVTLKKFVGTYRSTEGEDRTLEVTLKDGKLFLGRKKQWESELLAQDEGKFLAESLQPAVIVWFEQGKMFVEQGKITEWVKE